MDASRHWEDGEALFGAVGVSSQIRYRLVEGYLKVVEMHT
jgi:hypothetical protein